MKNDVVKKIKKYIKKYYYDRTIVYTEGDYNKYKNSTSSDCWSPLLSVDGYSIAISLPSPSHKDMPLQLFFDFIKI